MKGVLLMLDINYKEILQSIGYEVLDSSSYLQTAALYRGGNNKKALCIYKESGMFVDFVTGKKGSFKTLLQLSKDAGLSGDYSLLNAKTIEDLPEEERVFLSDSVKPKIDDEKFFKESCLKKLLPNHSYWNKRGISKETLVEFKGGLAQEGKLYQRYVFPIYNCHDKIIGFSGRSVTDRIPKWKHVGRKTNWVFPCHLNKLFIDKTKEVILVESIGDLLALWECGIKNVFCTFGTSISEKLLSHIISLNPEKIIISTNNDENLVGNNAALKIKEKFSHFFDDKKVIIKLPQKNDFGDMTKEEINKWKKE
jgi:5S rRNA maturation endonuclease (ribonuclease M5)